MENINSLCHSSWDCKYHIAWIPKYKRKAMFGKIRKHLGEIFRELSRQKKSQIEEGQIAIDHVHMFISIPPKYVVAQVVGFIKGKSAIYIARNFLEEGKEIFKERISGRVDTMYQQKEEMKKRSRHIL